MSLICKIFEIFILISCFTSINSLSFLCPQNLTTDDIECQIEEGDYRFLTKPIPDNLTIIEYNIDRNAYGGDSPYEQGLYNIISLMNGSNSPLPLPDVLIMSELARDCKEFGNYMNGPEEVAKQLGMYYGYVVEYVEINNETEHQCTIGNGLFSKYPIYNIDQLRFKHQCCKFNGRMGGRIAIYGDLINSDNQTITIYSTHLESGQGDVIDIADSLIVRIEQIREIIENTQNIKKESDYWVISGDFNAPFGDLDSVNIELMLFGFQDSHASLSYFDRNTCPFDTLSQYDIFVFDYIWGNGKKAFSFENPIICNLEYSKNCYGASDHSPIMATLKLK